MKLSVCLQCETYKEPCCSVEFLIFLQSELIKSDFVRFGIFVGGGRMDSSGSSETCYGGGDLASAIILTIIFGVILLLLLRWLYKKYWINRKGKTHYAFYVHLREFFRQLPPFAYLTKICAKESSLPLLHVSLQFF